MNGAPTNAITLMYKVYRHILPNVRTELRMIRDHAMRIPDTELKKQALDSIQTKAFHCQGGAVYALLNLAEKDKLIALIVSFQTISDYLDNLCDRSVSLDPEDFRLLHQAMLDAVQPNASVTDYYAKRGQLDDHGYLEALVIQCQTHLKSFTHYDKVQDQVVKLVRLYCDLQVYKHIAKENREAALLAWWDKHKSSYPDLEWQEFAAATGSTLAVFLSFAMASLPDFNEDDYRHHIDTYFPFVCGLHILLDYFIDQEEDVVGGDLNFCNYYEDENQLFIRLEWFISRAKLCVSYLPNYQFHGMILEGLLALYLSDAKVNNQALVRQTVSTMMKGASFGRLFFWINSNWIRKIYK